VLVVLGSCIAIARAGAIQTQTEPPPPMTGGGTLQPNETCSITGGKVRGPEGQDYGRVIDVLVDRNGRPQMAVIRLGGFLGVGWIALAIPWTHLHFSPAGGPEAPVQLDLTAHQLSAYPPYRPGAGPVTMPGRQPGC
jgi:hypothetical protein